MNGLRAWHRSQRLYWWDWFAFGVMAWGLVGLLLAAAVSAFNA